MLTKSQLIIMDAISKAREEQINVIANILVKVPQKDLDIILARVKEAKENPDKPIINSSTETL